MNKQRILLLVLGAIALGGLVAACGGSSNSSSSSSSQTSSSTPAASATSTTSATTASTPATSSSASTSSTTTTVAAAGGSAAGKTVFKSTCGACHTLAAAATHGAVGPNLDQVKPSRACVVQQVTNGGAVKPPCPAIPGAIMPSFAHTLSPTQIQSVAEFVSSAAGTVKGTTSTTGGGLP